MAIVRFTEDGTYTVTERQSVEYVIDGGSERFPFATIDLPAGEYPVKVGRNGGPSSALGIEVAKGGNVSIQDLDTKIVVTVETNLLSAQKHYPLGGSGSRAEGNGEVRHYWDFSSPAAFSGGGSESAQFDKRQGYGGGGGGRQVLC